MAWNIYFSVTGLCLRRLHNEYRSVILLFRRKYGNNILMLKCFQCLDADTLNYLIDDDEAPVLLDSFL